MDIAVPMARHQNGAFVETMARHQNGAFVETMARYPRKPLR
jgi:hypothetical protein